MSGLSLGLQGAAGMEPVPWAGCAIPAGRTEHPGTQLHPPKAQLRLPAGTGSRQPSSAHPPR